MWLHYISFSCAFLTLCFLLMTYYLLFLLYLFYTGEIMLDKKKIQGIFLFKFKMDHKAVETTSNINNAFSSGIANECTVQWWFKKFCKGQDSLEGEENSGWPSEVNNDNWGDHQSWSSHNYTRNCLRTRCRPFYSHSAFEAN